MGKIITSPVKKFGGTVTLKDPIPYSIVTKFEAAIRNKGEEDTGEKYIPPIIEIVEKWDLENFPQNPTAESFPGTPRKPVFELIAWLITEINNVYRGNEDGDPNA